MFCDSGLNRAVGGGGVGLHPTAIAISPSAKKGKGLEKINEKMDIIKPTTVTFLMQSWFNHRHL